MMRYAAIWSIGTLLSSLLEGGEAFHLPAAVTRKVSSTSLSSSNVPIIGDLEAPQASESKGQLSDEEWQKLPDAPGPRQWPLVGNMIKLLRLGAPDKYDAWVYKKYGPIARSKLLGQPWYTISSPQEAREVFTLRSKDFDERAFPETFASVVENKGLIFTNGPEHVRNRRMSHPAFHRQEILDGSSAVVVDLAKQLAKRYKKCASGTTIDLYDDMKSLTLEVISQASFSLPLNLLRDDKEDHEEESSSASSPMMTTATLEIDGRRMDQLTRDYVYYLGRAARPLIPNAHKYGLSRSYRKLKKVWEEMGQIEDVVIDQRRAYRRAIKAGGGKLAMAKDLLDVYLESIEGGEEEEMSNDAIRRNCHDVFFAGSDTTATTISSTIFEIVKRPQIKAKVLAELDALDIDDLEQMKPNALGQKIPFLDICLKEALRLYPVLPASARRALRNTSLGGFRIPKGAAVVPSILNLHLSTDLWGDDAKLYRPERWLTLENGLPPGVPQGSYLPFGIGPRACLGYRFALMEVLIVTSVLLKTINFDCLAPDQTLQPIYPGQLGFKDGIKLIIKGESLK